MLKKLPYYLILFFCFTWVNATSQANTKEAKKTYDKAIALLADNNNVSATKEAIELLEASIQNDQSFIAAHQVLFQLYLDIKKFDKATLLYEKASQLDSSVFLPYIIKYATAYASMGQYEKANTVLINLFNSGSLPSYLKNGALSLQNICAFALSQKYEPLIQVTNAGDSINTNAAEYFPTLTVQDSLFVFMRRNNWKREDFFMSTINPLGFTQAKPLSDSLNIADKKGSPSLSADLQTLYYAADYGTDGYGRYDIYKVTKTKTGWSLPKNLGRNINTDFWESAPSISPDGQALYFCSNVPGGYGGIDIYVSFKNEKGYWEEAINLGPSINTIGDEQTPFIHADNKTLYFASNGWPGYGGSDLFMSSIKLDGTWTKPLNLGFPINTFDNEGSIAVKGNGAEGYIASDRQDSRGGLDIYKVVLSPLTRANKTYYFNGFIADATTKKPLAGIVNLVDPIATENFMQINVDTTGYFVLALPYFDSLGIRINSEAHEYASMLISADSLNKMSGNTFNFYLAAIEKQYSKKFNNVFFDLNTAQLKKSASVELDALVSYLSTTPNATILIEGHTDNTGTVAFNLALSSQRAQAIAQYLIAAGINKLRISTTGYGATKPVASNDTEAGRALNRRTGFTITIQ